MASNEVVRIGTAEPLRDITFKVPPSYSVKNKNCIKFIVKDDKEDLSPLSKAVRGDVLVLGDGKKFLIDTHPMNHYFRKPGRLLATDAPARITESIVIGRFI